MAIDASIALQTKVPEYASPLQRYSQMQQLKGTQNQSRLADLTFADAERKSRQKMAFEQEISSLTPEQRQDRGTMLRIFEKYNPEEAMKYGAKSAYEQQDYAAENDRINKGSKLTTLMNPQATPQPGQQIQPSQDALNIDPVHRAQQIIAARREDARARFTSMNPKISAQGKFDLDDLNRNEEAKQRAIEQRATNAARIAAGAAARPSDAVTPIIVQDKDSQTGWSHKDARTGRVTATGAPSPTGSMERLQSKLDAGLPQAKLRVESMKQNIDRLDFAMDELHKDPGLANITGTVAGRTWNLTNTATGAQAKLNSIKSQIFQSSLQAMREASKTGGAVGNVSDKEGDKLERTLAALDQAQSTADFRKELKKAINQVRLSKELIQNAFTDQYGDAPESKSKDSGWKDL